LKRSWVAEVAQVGSLSLASASRSHIAVCGVDAAEGEVLGEALDRSTGQTEEGRRALVAASALTMSNWKTWTSSCPRTWSVSAISPGQRHRHPVAQPLGEAAGALADPPKVTVVCRKSGWSA
jgi:hypothetical protein